MSSYGSKSSPSAAGAAGSSGGAIELSAPDLIDKLSEISTRRSGVTAVEAPEGSVDYAELETLSNRLAHHLIGLGVAPGCRVGISLDRGLREVIAMLATAKAGGTYIPLDPSQPSARLLGIAEDADPQVLIVQSGSPLDGAAAPVIFPFDAIADIPTSAQSSATGIEFDETQVAYIMFTSGSTGRPKGVEVSRGALSNFLRSMAHTPGLVEDDRLLAITTTSFDISGLELFLPLWVGATVVIVDRETSQDPRLLRHRVEGDSISVMQATPATWRLLLEAGWSPDPRIRMFCGGEALYSELAAALLADDGELWNLYGPTETTIWSSIVQIRAGDGRISIGMPIDHTQMYILDEQLVLVADGEEGELCIGGRGVAKGYYGRPDLTAERFVINPHGPAGDRIYRTGDLARKLPDGQFECLGRLDHQVKIRGYRVELEEIEAVLCGVPGVQGVVVVADPGEDHDPRLLAYWVGNVGRDALIAEARRKLPAHIMPSAYIPLEAFPLNSASKVDRNQLPRPQKMIDERFLKPDREPTTLEARVACICCDVLELDQMGLREDFFTIGGTSVRAAEVVALMHAETGIEMPLQAFFVSPTVEGIAAQLEGSFSPDAPAIVELREGPEDRSPVWCLFGITVYRHLAAALAEDRTVLGVHVPFRYVPGRDHRPTTREVAKGYVEVIRQRQGKGPYHLLGLCFGGIVAFEAAAQLEELGEKVELVTVVDAVLPTALQIDRVQRVTDYISRVVREPIDFLERVRGKLGSLLSSLLARATKRLPWNAGLIHGHEAIDLPVDGPEVEAEVTHFAMQSHRIASPILITRATGEARPAWEYVRPDLGWESFSDTVVIQNIDADHLETLRPPYVHALARAIEETTESYSGLAASAWSQPGRRSSVLSISEMSQR